MRDFLDVVDDCIKHPLKRNLDLSAQRESAHAFRIRYVAEYRLDDAHSLTVDRARFGRVDFVSHAAARVFLIR